MNKLDKQYTDLLQDILDNGVTKQDRTGTGTISVFARQIRHNMKDGFPLLTTKKMPFKTIVTELLWFLRGDTNIKFLVDNNCHIWDGDAYKNYINNPAYKAESVADLMGSQAGQLVKCSTQEEFINKIKTDDEFAKKWGELGPIYGKQWRNWEAKLGYMGSVRHDQIIDQIQNLINDLKTNPDSRRLMVNAWNVGELDQMVLPPCHYGFQVYTRELSESERVNLYYKKHNKGRVSSKITKFILDNDNIPTRAISLMWNQRSVDTFLGLPFNIASYGLLLEIIAKSVNMVPDELIGNLGDVHLYSNHIKQAKEQIGREGFELPKLNINTEWWPTLGGECGEGPLDANAVFEGFKDDNFCRCLLEEDIQLYDYQSHPAIKAPLSN
jgi:thymidylate synthase